MVLTMVHFLSFTSSHTGFFLTWAPVAPDGLLPEAAAGLSSALTTEDALRAGFL